MDAADGSNFFQVIGTNFFVLRQQLAGGGAESTAGAGKVGTNGEDFGERGVGKEDGGYILCGSGVGRAFVWVRDVVSDPPDGEGPHGLPPPGGPTMAGMSPERQRDGT